MLLCLLSRIHIDLALTNASRVPRTSEVVVRSFGVLLWRKTSVDNYLEGAVTGRHVQLRRKTIRDRVEEKEARRGVWHRAPRPLTTA